MTQQSISEYLSSHCAGREARIVMADGMNAHRYHIAGDMAMNGLPPKMPMPEQVGYGLLAEQRGNSKESK